MRLIQCKLDWVDVLWDWTLGILYTNTDRTTLTSETSKESIKRAHRVSTSPTEAKTRVVTLEWVIDLDGNANAQNALVHLQQMFALQEDLYEIQPKELYIQDIFGNERTLQVHVVDLFEHRDYTDDMMWYALKRRVVLESTDSPHYRSLEEFLEIWTNGVYGTFDVDFDVPLDIDWSVNGITIEQIGNAPAPIKRVITVTQDFVAPLLIYNTSNQKYCLFDISWLVWEEIVIDWTTRTATKDWSNIILTRQAGSNRLTVKWNQTFVIVVWTSWEAEDFLNVNAYFNTMLQ